MTQKLSILKDVNGIATGGIPFPDDSSSFYTTLANNVAQTLTVPNNVNMALFSFTPLGVFVSQGDDPISLPGSSFAATTADQNPVVRQVLAGATLNFIASTDTFVQVRFFNNVIAS